ncbi:Splicing factor [Marasmius crinis-equi]|uniref:Splicing factor n=1 Tax=Marasmius crinis-equi TaxID=585013 RepID=A0ABR3FLF2_9AGAR
MDQEQALEAFANILNILSEKPYDFSSHLQHIRIASSLEGMETEAKAALETFTSFYAAGDEVWIPLIEAKESTTDMNSAQGVSELLALYEQAEGDYLSIPILKRHIEFVISRYEAYTTDGNAKPEEFGEMFSVERTRAHLTEVVNKGAGHLTESHLLWDQLQEWELGVLESATPAEKPSHIIHAQALLLNRLKEPHSNSDSTFQVYSTFTTNHKPPQEYESLLVAASKSRSQAVKAFQRRESFETELKQSGCSLETYSRYALHERRAKNADTLLLSTVYERAISEAAKRRFKEEVGAELTLRAFWCGYLDALRINNVEDSIQLSVLRRSVRSVPGSGEVWARYIRFLERADEQNVDLGNDNIPDVYAKAFSVNLLQSDVEQVIPVVLARAGSEKRRIEEGTSDDETLPTLISNVETGIELVHQASSAGDSRLRLEKFLSEIYRIAETLEGAVGVWQSATKFYKNSYLAWTAYTEALMKADQPDEARKTFSDISMKNLDWPEAIWEAWLAFEHLHGTVEQIEACMDKIEKAQYQVNMRRAKEAEKASMQAMQMAAEQQASVPVVEAPVPDVGGDDAMEVDSSSVDRGTKRPAEDDLSADGQKRARQGKDRENSTVFVSELSSDVTDDELISLFKDCGKIRETKITHLPNSTVATVEFLDRDAVPAALTKDKKRIRGNEMAVHLAWQSTLYITNFPESADDAYIRNLFGKYGTIFDVRWPSKKFKSTRRFCYLQYTSPKSAQSALELHGRELEPDLRINVYISNPERKKERTDHDANEREVYVAGLNKSTTKADLERFFGQYGPVKEVRLATDDNNNSKGFAFIEFEETGHAVRALEANNQDLKNRRIAVTLADPRAKGKNTKFDKATGLGRKAELKSRSVRITNLPPATQEGLLQQAIEKIAVVKRLEVFAEKGEALVEFDNAAVSDPTCSIKQLLKRVFNEQEAGKLLLRTEPLIFNGNTLSLSEETSPSSTSNAFIPRTAASRPKAGLGHKRKLVAPISQDTQPKAQSSAAQPARTSAGGAGKGQDDFRKMLGGK